jgi:integrase
MQVKAPNTATALLRTLRALPETARRAAAHLLSDSEAGFLEADDRSITRASGVSICRERMDSAGAMAVRMTSARTIVCLNNERHHYPQRREMLLIARACKHREVRAGIRIAFYSGMRKSEILRAKVTKKGFVLTDTKNGKPRIVPIHPRIAVLTRRIRFTVSANVFGNHFEAARDAAGFPGTHFHDLRHAAASEMINAGVDLFIVGGVLGHLSIVSTKRYSHLVTEKLANAVKKIGTR